MQRRNHTSVWVYFHFTEYYFVVVKHQRTSSFTTTGDWLNYLGTHLLHGTSPSFWLIFFTIGAIGLAMVRGNFLSVLFNGEFVTNRSLPSANKSRVGGFKAWKLLPRLSEVIIFYTEINLFWAQHQVHHSSEEYNFPVGLRQSFFQGWCSFVSKVHTMHTST